MPHFCCSPNQYPRLNLAPDRGLSADSGEPPISGIPPWLRTPCDIAEPVDNNTGAGADLVHHNRYSPLAYNFDCFMNGSEPPGSS